MKDLVRGGKWWRANLRQGLEEALRSLGLRQGTGVTRATTHMKQGAAAETSHLLHTVVRTWDGAGRREAWRTLFFSAEAGRSRRCTSTRQRCASAPRPCLAHSRRATAVSYSMRSCGRQHPAVRLSACTGWAATAAGGTSAHLQYVEDAADDKRARLARQRRVLLLFVKPVVSMTAPTSTSHSPQHAWPRAARTCARRPWTRWPSSRPSACTPSRRTCRR